MRQVPVFRKLTDLLTAVKQYQSLITFSEEMRETFDDIEINARIFVDNPEYMEVRALKMVKTIFYEKYTPDTVHLNYRENS